MNGSLTKSYLAAFLFVIAFVPPDTMLSAENGLARTPPMGWNSWNKFASNINETLVRQIADSMVGTGMRDAGYQYVILDDCWMTMSRNGSGQLVADPTKFPSGMKALADYVHARGLKLGIYEDRGSATCSGYPGSYGHEVTDANTFASWGVDYLKYDNCSAVGDLQTDYTAMAHALDSCGRSIVYSICCWSYPGPWAISIGNLWRTTTDITDNWSSVIDLMNTNAGLGANAGPGHWNDPDMLEVGNGGMSTTEYQAHFSMWAMMAAPLIAGNDVRSMASATKSILMNAEVIAVDQDSLGIQGTRVRVSGEQEVWSKPLKDGSRAVALLNRSSSSALVSFTWNEIGLLQDSAQVRDLWAHVSKGVFSKSVVSAVPAHGVTMLKIVPTTIDATFLSDMNWTSATTDSGSVRRDKSTDGNPLTLAGVVSAKGIGTHAQSQIVYTLSGGYNRFQCLVGVDDEVGNGGSVVFSVSTDGSSRFNSGVVTGTSASQAIDLDVTGVNLLTLSVEDGGDGTTLDHADWAGARVIRNVTGDTLAPSKPANVSASVILPLQQVRVTWSHSADNVGVAGYQLYRNDGATASTSDTFFVFTNSLWNTHYSFTVRAEDAVGNMSVSSDSTGATTGNAPTDVYLSDIPWVSATTGWETVQLDKSIDGHQLTLNGLKYRKGIGTHANSEIVYFLAKSFTRFNSYIGVDDEVTATGTIVFSVYADGVKKFDSGVMTPLSATQYVDVDITGADTLRMLVGDAGDGNAYDHADWAGAIIHNVITGVANSGNPRPLTYALGDNFPNPFNPTTVISYVLRERSKIRIWVYDVLGREVQVLVDGIQDAGTRTVEFHAATLATGVYFYRMTVTSIDHPGPVFTQTKKMILSK